MATWQQFTAAAPELAAFGAERLEGKVAYLATIRADGGPRVHPLTPHIARGRNTDCSSPIKGVQAMSSLQDECNRLDPADRERVLSTIAKDY